MDAVQLQNVTLVSVMKRPTSDGQMSISAAI